MVAIYSFSRPAPLTIDTKTPAALHAPPFASHILHHHERSTLQQMARKNSEKFARKIMQAAIELDSSEHGIEEASQNAGIEFVSSLNGIDIYEDMTEKVIVKLDEVDTSNAHKDVVESGTTQKSTQLRSLCHIDTDIHEFVKRMTDTSRPPLLPGIIDRHELCTVLETPKRQAQKLRQPLSPLEIEHAGIQWFVLNHESIQPDSALRPCRSKNNQQQHEQRRQEEVNGFDYVVLSYQGVFKHRERRGWMHWCQSVDVPFYPPLHPSSRYARGQLLSSGIVAVESATRPGHMSVSFVMGVDLRVCTRAGEIQMVQSVVWKQVMKLARMKKALERSSVARTLSVSTASECNVESVDTRGSAETNQSENGSRSDVAFVPADETPPYMPPVSPDSSTFKKVKEFNAPPPSGYAILNVLRNKRCAPLTERPDILRLVTENKLEREREEQGPTRTRAHSMQSYRGLHQSPSSNGEGSPKSLEFRLTFYQDPVETITNKESSSLGTTALTELYGQVGMSTGSRTRSISTGWI